MIIYKKLTEKCNTYIHHSDKSKFLSFPFLLNSYKTINYQSTVRCYVSGGWGETKKKLCVSRL